jgi:hypothetical protein
MKLSVIVKPSPWLTPAFRKVLFIAAIKIPYSFLTAQLPYSGSTQSLVLEIQVRQFSHD